MIAPMLAHALREKDTFLPGEWFAEEKLDGHRMIILNNAGLGEVSAWSRDGKVRKLPPHLLEAFSKTPDGLYDGELCVPGGKSYNVTELTKQTELVFQAFDLLVVEEFDLVERGTNQETRSALLAERLDGVKTAAIRLVPVVLLDEPDTGAQISQISAEVWNAEGEGLILKKRSGIYRPGKRSHDWIKIKQIGEAIFTIIGFSEGLMGPFSICNVEDSEGRQTAVKWKSHAWLAEAAAAKNPEGGHAWIGKRVWLQFHERTPDGLYRHPRWDRFAEVGE